MIFYGSISSFGGLIGFKICPCEGLIVIDCWIMYELWYGNGFLVSVCVNKEDVCYSRSSEQGSPTRK